MNIDTIKNETSTMSALYVEDDEDVREQTAKILRLFFNNVVECSDGHKGIFEFKKNKFNVVFSDINMPGINGLEMIKKIKEIDPFVNIIIFSAYSESEYFIKAIELGVTGYLLKPFSTSDLLKVLEKVAQISKIKDDKLVYLEENFIWDRENLILLKNNEIVKLTKNEIKLLQLLLNSKDRIISSLDIENELFDDDLCENKRVRNIIFRFHKKIDYKLIENIYSQGYRIKWK